MSETNYWLRFLTDFVGAGAGLLAAAFSLSKFLGDRITQKFSHELGKQLKIHEAQLAGPTHVTQLQLDTELQAMKDIFVVAGKLLIAMNSLRPTFDTKPREQTPEEWLVRLSSRLDVVVESHNTLQNLIESVYPFIQTDLYDAINKCSAIARCEIIDIQTSARDQVMGAFVPPRPGQSDWWRVAEENRTDFQAAFRKAADIARTRIASLSILPVAKG